MLTDKHGTDGLSRGKVAALRRAVVPSCEAEALVGFEQYHKGILEALREKDLHVYELLQAEYERLQSSIQLIAAENQCSPGVLAALGSVIQNKTTEGFVGGRYHAGCEVVDDVESLAVSRAKEAFGAEYANVQPHSGTAANQIVLTAMLGRGDKILSLGLDQGGHLSHGASVSFTGKFFEVENYYVDRQSFLLDYEAVRAKALACRPTLIICGASAYSRTIDFCRFREIAGEVGAYLLADISHIAGLVSAGAHPSPIDFAHFTTTSTYKPGGPRGGVILMGRDFDRKVRIGSREVTLAEHIQKTTFPGVQGTPYLNNAAGKAVFFKEMLSEEYRSRQFRIIENAQRLADSLAGLGYEVLTGGTDNHMVLVDVSRLRQGLTGAIAQKGLEQCGLIVNMNRLPYDTRGAAVTSGLRLGTAIVTKNGMGGEEMKMVAALIDSVLRGVEIGGEGRYRLDDDLRERVRAEVLGLCRRFPMC
ncbi:MAG: serine hydroxymethyltransferase [Sedimentisphaerales bacterium]|nr:serine hydroxymethyltransferase [Sedimentisphaerales bacterium]